MAELPAAEAQPARIEELMVGHTFATDRYREHEQRVPGQEVLLEVRELARAKEFEPVSFSVRKGEIVSLVGLVGSGKEAVCRCVNGLDRPDRGAVLLGGAPVPAGSPSEAVRRGIGHVPIDRRSDGLALAMSVAENINLLVLDRLKVGGFLAPRLEARNARKWIEDCRIKTPAARSLCSTLSGGNQQKTVIAKWLSSKVEVLILDHPTRGVDVGAKDEIYRILRGLARDGVGMIVMCDTLEEDIGLSNRMLIMKDGQLVREVECPPDRKPTPREIIQYIV